MSTERDPWFAARGAVGVCGFPRSGSSMTMRMLEAGGVPPVDGSSTVAYELDCGLEPLPRMPVARFVGRAVKLLDYPAWFSGLPPAEWRFIWLDRDPDEQARSHAKFMGLFMPGLDFDTRVLARSFRDDRAKLLGWFEARGDVLVSSFEAVLCDPLAEAARFAEFLPGLNASAAASIVQTRSAACAPDMAHELALVSEAATSQPQAEE